MKRTLLSIIIIGLSIYVNAQAPEKMSYQAVIRDSEDQIVTGQSIGMQISILQGSVTGDAVYVETQSPTTNVNGIISIEIGAGTNVSGVFAEIDWSNRPYFIQTETDPTTSGGTNYTITGTSQLLSIPYALHAKTAGSLSQGETDPLFSESVANAINADDTIAWHNKQEALKAGTGIELQSNTISATTYEVGDFALGGIVFWVDESGQHGLVCAKTDQSTGIRWFAGTTGNTRARGDGPFAGEMNTAIIIAAHVAIGDDGNNYAARLCNELSITEGGTTYSDWYLPSFDELDLMYWAQGSINTTAEANGGTAIGATTYWTSTQSNDTSVSAINFGSGGAGVSSTDTAYRVRAIRAF